MLSHTDYFCLTTGSSSKMKVFCPLTACRLAEEEEMLSRIGMDFNIAFFYVFSH